MDANNARYSTRDELDLFTIKIFLGERVVDEEGVEGKDAWRAVVGGLKVSLSMPPPPPRKL